MMPRVAAMLLVILSLNTVYAQQQELKLEAADGVKVFGTLYPTLRRLQHRQHKQHLPRYPAIFEMMRLWHDEILTSNY